jgi:hypothetical protein
MKIEGSLRSNLVAAVASARRLSGSTVHADTIDHWRRLLEYGRLNSVQPLCEPVTDVVAELERELARL